MRYVYQNVSHAILYELLILFLMDTYKSAILNGTYFRTNAIYMWNPVMGFHYGTVWGGFMVPVFNCVM